MLYILGLKIPDIFILHLFGYISFNLGLETELNISSNLQSIGNLFKVFSYVYSKKYKYVETLQKGVYMNSFVAKLRT